MKRSGGIFTFLSIMFSSLVSAQSGPVEGLEQLSEGAREMVMIVIQFISDVLFDLESFDEFFFAKIMILLIVFFITYTVLKNNNIFGKDKKITIIISSAISILAIRYLPTEFVQVILLQYGAFAVGITTLIPLMIFFFFLHQSGFGHRGRQLGWLIYGASLIALTGFRYSDLGSASYIYYAGVIGVAFALLLDEAIHTQFLGAEKKQIQKQRNLIYLMELENKRRKFIEGVRASGRSTRGSDRVLRGMDEEIKEVRKKVG